MCTGKKYTLSAALKLPRFDRSVSALCWAYNEEILIGEYLDRLHALMSQSASDFEIVIIDDCSTDNTPQIIRERMLRYPEIRYLRNETNMNVGPSFKRAVRSATKEFVFWQTVDWSYDISQIRLHLEFLHEFDVVAGVRRAPVLVADRFIKPVMGILRLLSIKHLTRRSDTPWKAFVSVVNYLLIRLLFGVKLSDYQNVAYYRTSLIQSIEWEASSSFVSPETIIKAYWRGARIVEVPISFRPRTAGEGKGVSVGTIARALRDILGCWIKWRILGRVRRGQTVEITRMVESEWDLGDASSWA